MALSDLTSTWRFQVTYNAEIDTEGLSSLNRPGQLSKTFNTTFGVAAEQMNNLYDGVLQIAASGNSTIDLAGGVTNVLGEASGTILKIKAILVWLLNEDDDATIVTGPTLAASSITIGAGSSPIVNPFLAAGDGLVILSGGCFMLTAPTADGYTITAGTADILRVLNNDGSNAARVRVIIGGDIS